MKLDADAPARIRQSKAISTVYPPGRETGTEATAQKPEFLSTPAQASGYCPISSSCSCVRGFISGGKGSTAVCGLAGGAGRGEAQAERMASARRMGRRFMGLAVGGRCGGMRAIRCFCKLRITVCLAPMRAIKDQFSGKMLKSSSGKTYRELPSPLIDKIILAKIPRPIFK